MAGCVDIEMEERNVITLSSNGGKKLRNKTWTESHSYEGFTGFNNDRRILG